MPNLEEKTPMKSDNVENNTAVPSDERLQHRRRDYLYQH